MLGWLRGLTPGFDWRGRMKYLLGRDPDPDACRVPGASPQAVERALSAVCDAFLVPAAQRYCLRALDELAALYRSTNPPGFPDALEFTHLYLGLEAALGRPLSEPESAALRTVGDVVQLVGGGPEAEPSAAADPGRV